MDGLSEAWHLAVECTTFKSAQFRNLPDSDQPNGALANRLGTLGLRKDRTVLLQDKGADTKRIQFEFGEMMGRVHPGQTLIVSYSGHGYFEKGSFALATYNALVAYPGWRLDRAADILRKRFRGRRVVWILDCCFAGAASDQLSRSGKSCLLLASCDRSTEIQEGWAFTDAVSRAAAGVGDWSDLAIDIQSVFPGAVGWSAG